MLISSGDRSGFESRIIPTSSTGRLYCANGHTEFLNKEEYRMVIYKFRMIELYFQKLGIEVLNMELAMEGDTFN